MVMAWEGNVISPIKYIGLEKKANRREKEQVSGSIHRPDNVSMSIKGKAMGAQLVLSVWKAMYM